MTPQIQYTLSGNALYLTIQKAIRQQKNNTGQKPSLVQINRQDYQELTRPYSSSTTLGLAIDNVTVVSFIDVDPGSFIFIP